MRFRNPQMRLKDKYDGQYDLCMHLTKWTKVYGEEPQPEWVHLFYHTLDVIPMNWYIKTKLYHGMSEWDILRKRFLLTFTFEDRWWDTVDDVLQAVKTTIFEIPQEPIELIQPEWATQMSYALECYNVNTEEDDKDPRKVDIPETEGYREVQGPLIEDPNITALVKTKQVNIGTEAEPKYVMLGNYWDDAMVDKVVELFCKYQDLFLTKIADLKGIIGDLGMMRITLSSTRSQLSKGLTT